MSHRTSATIILDSITPYGEEVRRISHRTSAAIVPPYSDAMRTRLTSIYCVFPKMILGERNRHRGFSLSDRSSRAVPPEKLIAEVREDPATPALFRKRSKGMGGGDQVDVVADWPTCILEWRFAASSATDHAERLNGLGLAKEIVNRPLDPYIRMHSLMTATRDVWLNFFGLRLDAGADPTIQVLARRCFEAYKFSTPRLLTPGEWHLPFVDESDWRDATDYAKGHDVSYAADARLHGNLDRTLLTAQRLSAARCAHLSYNDLETGRRMTVERALAIYDKLAGSRPIHASPMEHLATPDRVIDGRFEYSEKSGNFCNGWVQYRKLFPGEDIADLPEGYSL